MNPHHLPPAPAIDTDADPPPPTINIPRSWLDRLRTEDHASVLVAFAKSLTEANRSYERECGHRTTLRQLRAVLPKFLSEEYDRGHADGKRAGSRCIAVEADAAKMIGAEIGAALAARPPERIVIPAAVVNVSPTPVTIENEVNVEQRPMKFTTDGAGNVTARPLES